MNKLSPSKVFNRNAEPDKNRRTFSFRTRIALYEFRTKTNLNYLLKLNLKIIINHQIC